MKTHSSIVGVFQNTPIAKRLSMGVVLALLAFAVAILVYAKGEKVIRNASMERAEFSRFADEAASLQNSFEGLRLPLLSYTGRHSEAAALNFKTNLTRIESILVELIDEARAKRPGFIPIIEGLQSQIKVIGILFLQVEKYMDQQGFDQKHGLWKRLGDSVALVEKEIKSWPKTEKLQSKLAVMKSYQADFMLRKNLIALQKHKKTFNEFDFAIWETEIDQQTRDLFTNLIAQYRKDLETFAGVDQLVAKAVVKLKKSIGQSEPLFEEFFIETQAGIEQAQQKVAVTKTETERSIALSVGVVLLLYCLLSFLLARSLTVPLKRMKVAMERLASGDILCEVPDQDRLDEIGGMAKSIEVFKQGLIQAGQLAEEKEQETVIRDRRRATLESAIGRFEGGIAEVLASIDHASSGMDRTANGMNDAAYQTHVHVDHAELNSKEASESVRAVAQATEELSTALTAIAGRVDTSARATRMANDTARQAKDRISSLLSVTSHVREILELIEDIADKTRLLSLNANIEATRAGAAGRGFSVVAKEVKDLATKTADATKLINTQINGITLEADKAMISIDTVVSVIGEARELSDEIASVILDQERTTKLISSNVQAASDSATDATGKISFVKDAAQGSKKIANDVSKASENLARHSRVLKDEVEDFLNGIRAA